MVGGGCVSWVEDVSPLLRYLLGMQMLIERCRFQLGLGWFGDYDSYDLASLSLLSHGPTVGDALCAQVGLFAEYTALSSR